jgi:cytochrome c oxidase subunit II
VESFSRNFSAVYFDPHPTSIFSPFSTPGREIDGLSHFVLAITAGIFLVVSILLVYVITRYRARPGENSEPPQVFGSLQVELSWTIIPILIIVVLFLSTARVLFSIQDAPKPSNALDVVVTGHQFWWEFQYPQYGVITANELHLPLSTRAAPRPAFLKLMSADVIHSFWVPELNGKTDLVPNKVNEMWIDPQKPGLYLGQCAQFCGAEHAKMLLRVYVDTPEQFQKWITGQQKTQPELGANDADRGGNAPDAKVGQADFEHAACFACHTVSGTAAFGRVGPNLTHLMSRETLAAGIIANNAQNLKAWIADPDTFKPGSLMPALHLSDQKNAEITAYLLTLK